MMAHAARLLRLWFTFAVPVDRRTYLLHGAGLMVGKYLLDAAAVRLVYDMVWTPADYLSPLFLDRTAMLARGPDGFVLLMAAWTLPFIWIGIGMTARRAVDAGFSAWLALLFFVPFVNYGLMLGLCLAPSQPGPRLERPQVHPVLDDRLKSALAGTAAGVGLALAMVVVSVLVFRNYGVSLFLGTPFALGAASAFIHNRGHPRTLAQTGEVVIATVVITGGALLLFALEGAVCIAMAAPLALVLAMLGAALGREIALRLGGRLSHAAAALLVLPAGAGLESVNRSAPTYETRSAVEVAAPPEVVWRYVVSFSELPRPASWVFRTGIAYPIRARMEGRGVGAVRHCEFSTGAFVEPITRWDEPTRLSFDVRAQPPALEEWSPYARLDPPHLDGFLRSQRGEFRLIPLADGGTRLEGSTWYDLKIHPRLYWRIYADLAIRAIHTRVLTHVKERAEAAAFEYGM